MYIRSVDHLSNVGTAYDIDPEKKDVKGKQREVFIKIRFSKLKYPTERRAKGRGQTR